MDVRLLAGTEELVLYDTWVKAHPGGSLWQSLKWKTYQEALGRETKIYALMDGAQIAASALVVIDRTAFGFSTWDIPRGPLAAGSEGAAIGTLLATILQKTRIEKCLSLFLSPPYPLPPTPYPLAFSLRHEQPSATRVIDLTLSEEEILKQMKPKGRYNISVAEKNGVRVEESQDIDTFYRLMKETGGRDRFGIKPLKHYEAFLKKLPGSFLLLAYASSPPVPLSIGEGGVPRAEARGGGEVIAGLLGVIWGKSGIYYYGASQYDSRAFMAPYALQWAAMRYCKERGCTSYDLLGISPTDADVNHPWHGVSIFKEKFGGDIVTYPPEQQLVLRPMVYRMLRMKRKLLG